MARKTKKIDNKRKLIAKLNPKSPISEQYRTIRTNIQFASADGELRSFMVTSASQGEGKSTTAANLAIVFAQQGKRVLLVDSDLRKPTMHYTFRVTNTVGLTNVLTRQASLVEAVQATDVEKLDLLSSGPIPPNPAELLSSRMMEQMLAEAYKQYDLVIFDSPPVLAVTDAQVLANQCQGTVLVVKSGVTELESALKAKELLQAAKAKLLGAVLNNKALKSSSYYYYYGDK
ncbi:CpsD/CapB family tyrosine-protein kinase [Bacillus smithii]|uniref:non-specific protein-tyrosine kinase n=1 Tax=Bacillus smithii 7_3_47FAA TaxID=665952 RepID=G9QKR4_9BACI|nr:CpsD/CapB family tyrosine-protein kinase [Bacillus smithii]EHL78260.1 capsular exopolysaccharide family protein [Bacillus smithii 7_3_47FAA]